MKSVSRIYRITAILMALLMFLTSIGLMIDMHYCKGELKTISLFGKAKSCHEIGEGMQDCPHHKKMMMENNSEDDTINKKGCCSNKTLHIQSDQDQQYQVDKAVVVDAQLQHFIIAFVEVFLKSAVVETTNSTYTQYKPPLISRDIYVLLEAYLL